MPFVKHNTTPSLINALNTEKKLQIATGRPVGALNKLTRIKMKQEEVMLKEFYKATKAIAKKQIEVATGNNSMQNWRAGDSILDRTFGKALETKNINIDAQFSLKSLAEARKDIKDEPLSIENEIIP